MADPSASAKIERLLEVMARLRDPKDGCAWDVEQDFASIAPYTIEEAYEVEDAIRRGDFVALRDELGDLLLQVVFHARMAEEEKRFDFGDVVEAIVDKLVRRHPHVFGEGEIRDAAAQLESWENLKAQERERKGEGPVSALDDVPHALPALLRASKLVRRATRVGFDWPDDVAAVAKLLEELGELAEEIRRGGSREHEEVELGDVLFAAAALARRRGMDPEQALRDANARFERRFRAMESRLSQAGRKPEALGSDEWLALWKQVRAGEESG